MGKHLFIGKVVVFLIIILAFSSCDNSANMTAQKFDHTNALINESSPYLLQHAHNPVDWFPWGDFVLDKAEKEDKLLIISIGYSSCHWCHVMEEESFEDSLVASIMNENFVSIKVDREERPDVDDVYMTACNMINGSGGWPLNVVALPDGRPVWAGTYFPKEQWINILEQFNQLKKEDYSRLTDIAERLTAGLNQIDQVIDVPDLHTFSKEELDIIGQNFLKNIDFVNGGQKGSPKFPMPSIYNFLLKYAFVNSESKALKAATVTLDQMAMGGIFDQIEGGFARYSTDSIWKVPHFEKMLYDNAQMLSLYADAYAFTNNPEYLSILEKTYQFMMDNWKDSSGGYYSSYDADSEGEEGKYYTWETEEIASIIPEDELELFKSYYSIAEDGNWEETNILYKSSTDDDFLKRHNISESYLHDLVKEWNNSLLEKRKNRVYPGLDDKILCSWNSLLLTSFCRAYRATGELKYKDEAENLASFLLTNMLDDDGVTLFRNYKDGKVSISAFLDDYSLLISSLIDLYEITFNEEYLMVANELTDHVLKNFKNRESSIFNFTSDLSQELIARKAELADNVIPGSNSVMARNLYKLGLLFYNQAYKDQAVQMVSNLKQTILGSNQPNFYSNWCSLIFDLVYDPYEIAIVGPEAKKKAGEIMTHYHPNAIFLGGEGEGSLELLKDKLQEGETFIYVCVNKSCKLPVQDELKALEMMSLN